MRWMCGIVLLCLPAVKIVAQRATERPLATGALTGHVSCADTNLPARFASVTLQPVEIKPEQQFGPPTYTPMSSYQTLLDGSYSIQRVKPGTYYVVVQKMGYLSPFFQFTPKELENPTPTVKQRIAKAVPIVTIEANHTTALDVRLEHGAVISGTVRYDDGSAVSRMTVVLLTRGADADKLRWDEVRAGSYGNGTNLMQTDDLGRFRLVGIPAGEYLVQANIQLLNSFVDRLLGSSSNTMSMPMYNLAVYGMGVTRQNDAKPIKLQDGEERDGEDIVIPLSKLHTVTGNLVNQAGQAVNFGTVSIHFADDGAELASTQVDKEDAMFHFEYLPEGEYVLKVKDAAEVVRTEVSNGVGMMPPSHTEVKFLKSYRPKQQPLVVQNDLSGVMVVMPEKPAASSDAVHAPPLF